MDLKKIIKFLFIFYNIKRKGEKKLEKCIKSDFLY